MPRHPRAPRPDAGPYRSMLDYWALSLRAAGTSERTITIYGDAGALLAGWLRLNRTDLDDWMAVGREDIRGWLAWLQVGADPCPHRLDGSPATAVCTGYSKSSVNQYARSMQGFFAWLAEEEQVTNPMLGMKVPAAPKDDELVVPLVSHDQLAALIGAAEKGRDYRSRRDAAILRLLACTGVRLAELAQLRADALDLKTREVTVVGKAGKIRRVKFDHKCNLALARYLRMRERHPAVVQDKLAALWIGERRRSPMTNFGIYHMIAGRGAELGMKLHPHMFRHRFAHAWKVAGGGEEDLMYSAGWESPQMARRYGRLARAERARSAYDKLDLMGGV